MVRSHLDVALRGAAAGLLGGAAMDLFTRAVNATTEGLEAHGGAPGSDDAARGAQAPQASRRAGDDATVKVGAAAYQTIAGRTPPRAARPWLGSAAHYAFSATAGAVYAVAAQDARWLRGGSGTLFGTLVWLTADEGIVPALGLSKPPWQVPAPIHLYSLVGHWIYGATVHAAVRPGATSSAKQRACLPTL